MSKRITRAIAAAGAAVLLAAPLSVAAPAEAAPHTFKNCDAMHKRFEHGVGLKGAKDHTSGDPVINFARKPRWYKKNTSLDRDKDKIACEAH
jgi:hypothetical protein